MNKKYFFSLLIIVILGIIGVSSGVGDQIKVGGDINSGDTAWLLTASGLVLLMTPGLSFFYAGMVTRKSVISTMLQSYIALGLISILWIVFLFGLCFGDTVGGIIGNPLTFFMFKGVGFKTHPDLAPTIPFALFALYQLKFAIITPALVTGAFAERIKFKSYLIFMSLFSIFIYAPLAHATWHPQGFLRLWGVLDFAGGTVVHISAGMAALAGSLFLGPRKEIKHEAAHIPYILLGTGLLWFGWFGFNAGSSLAANDLGVKAFLNTHIASAVAMISWIFLEGMNNKKPSATGACIGAVVGLVTITPAAGFVGVGASILIGFVGTLCSYYAVKFKGSTRIDDTLDVFPCHGVGGIVGMILTAVFAESVGLIYGQTKTFFYHLLALLIVIIFTFVVSYILYFITNPIEPIRVSPEEEKDGLDLSQHGESL